MSSTVIDTGGSASEDGSFRRRLYDQDGEVSSLPFLRSTNFAAVDVGEKRLIARLIVLTSVALLIRNTESLPVAGEHFAYALTLWLLVVATS